MIKLLLSIPLKPNSLDITVKVATQGKNIERTTRATVNCFAVNPKGASIPTATSFRKNPIVQAFVKNRRHCEDLAPEKIRETSINEPLINWHAIDGDHALDAVRNSQGWAADASDKNMRSFARLIREKEGLQVLPASTAGLFALVEGRRRVALPNDRYVVVLTGRNS